MNGNTLARAGHDQIAIIEKRGTGFHAYPQKIIISEKNAVYRITKMIAYLSAFRILPL